MVTEIALATVLLIAGGLLIRSFGKLVRVELGYDPENVVTFQVSLPGGRRPPQQLKMLPKISSDACARYQVWRPPATRISCR